MENGGIRLVEAHVRSHVGRRLRRFANDGFVVSGFALPFLSPSVASAVVSRPSPDERLQPKQTSPWPASPGPQMSCQE